MKPDLKLANEFFSKEDYDKAIDLYNQLYIKNSFLRPFLEFNINLALKRKIKPLNEINDVCISEQLIVYSCNFGNYESVKEPPFLDERVRYILFTDNSELVSKSWEIVLVDTMGLNPRHASRLPKLLPHRYLPNHEMSIYLDSSLTIIDSHLIEWAIDSLDNNVQISGYSHFKRDCIYDEIEECILLGKSDKLKSKCYYNRLRSEDFPDKFGLLENALLIRRNNKEMKKLNESWYREFCRGPERDQFYLMYLLWKNNIKYDFISDASQFRLSPKLIFDSHNEINEKKILRNDRFKINWVIGGKSSKGWAYEINAKRLIKLLPEFDHVINGNEPSDCAIYFDSLIYKNYPKVAGRSILRLGGQNPIRRMHGDDLNEIESLLSKFDSIIALNNELKLMAASSTAVTYLIPNSLDLRCFPPKEISENIDSFTIGFAANCTSEMERNFKGLKIVESAAKLAGVKLKFLEKGDSQLEHNNMVDQFYHQIDCLVHPVSPGKEGCSNVIMEALACGIPVITTKESGFHGEMLTHAVNVLFCERTETDLAEKIISLKNNSNLRKRIIKSGLNFARDYHDIDSVVYQYRKAIFNTINTEKIFSLKRPKLRIAMLTTSFWPKFAGMEMMVHNLATSLKRMGNDVVLFTNIVNEDYVEIEHEYDLVRLKLEQSSLREVFLKKHKLEKFDVIYVQGAYTAATLAHGLKNEFGLPVILRTHGEDIQVDRDIGYGLRLNPKKEAIIINNMNASDVNISISRHVLNEAKPLAEKSQHKVISNGIDFMHFSRSKKDILHRRFSLGKETKILLMVGRNVKKKTFHLAIHALKDIRNKNKDVVLVHVGKEGNGLNLRKISEELNVSEYFFEYGEANYFEMPDIYSSADIFVFPSKVETFGNVTIEAMASGLPCVEFDYGANKDKILDGRTGYIIPFGDVNAMVDALVELIDDKEKRWLFSNEARRFARQRFAWESIASQYHEVFLNCTLYRDSHKKKLKLAFVADKMVKIKGGGGEKSLTNLVNSMALRGHEVHVILKEKNINSFDLPFYPLHPSVKLCNIYGWKNNGLPLPKGKKELLLNEKISLISPDVVIGFFLPEFGYVARGVEGLDVPLLLSHRNDPKEKLINTTERYPTRLPHIDYANNRAQVLTVQMEPYIDLLPDVAKLKAVVIPNNVTWVPDTLCAKPNVEENRNIILNVARLVPAKNQELMLRAFSLIACKYSNWDVHIYGDGPLHNNLEELIKSLDLENRVILKGTTQDILPAYQNAKIYSFPSLYEGFSRALSEAMMHALPSVVIKDCICSDTFIGESGGGIVVNNNVEEYAKALEKLITNPENRKKLGVKARRYIGDFTQDKVDALWEESFLIANRCFYN